MDCSHLNLKAAPQCQSLNVTDCTLIIEMNLNYNNIELLRNESFSHFPNLIFLHLGSNPIIKYERDSFKSLERLE